MKKLKTATVKNWVSYQEATLRFEEGFTVIHGRNLDRPEKNSSNGAGKSLIVSLLPDLRYGAPPSPLKIRKSWKDNFKKGTEQSLLIADEHDNDYRITRYPSEMKLFKNGKDEKIRGKANVEAQFEKLLPLNEEQFYSLVYLDTKRPPILQYGTDVQRHAFIEKLYKLDIYDKLGVVVKKDWEKTQRLVQDIEVLDRQLSEKSSGIKGDPAELKKKHRQLVKKTEDIRQKVSDLLAERQQCRTFITLTENMDPSLDAETLSTKLKGLKRELRDAREERDEALANNKKHEAFATLQKTRQRLEEELEQYADVKIDKSVQEKVREDKQLLDKIELAVIENESVKKEIARLQKEHDIVNLFKTTLKEKLQKQADTHGSEKLKKQLNKERVLLRELLDNLKDTEDHFTDHDDQACPICATALDKQTMKDIILLKNKRIGDIRVKINVLEQMISHVGNQEKIKSLKAAIKEENKKLVEDIEDTKIVEARIEENEALLALMRKKILCKSKLQELPETDDVEPVELKPLEENIEKVARRVEKYTRLYDARVNLDRLELPFTGRSEAKEKQDEIDNALTEYQPLLDRVQEKLNRVSVDATRAETLSQEVSNLSTQITDLKLQSADHKIKTALRKAFGAKGIRKQRVAEIGAALEATFNDYADQIFDFPIRFELIISDTQFKILAHRNGGVSDVRSLSGAESRYFSLLTMLTLLKFCPTEMRLDTVVLDEMEANMDAPFKRRYIDVCLPKILELVPKVVVVTPQSEKELFIPKAKVYTVEKKGNVSTLLHH